MLPGPVARIALSGATLLAWLLPLSPAQAQTPCRVTGATGVRDGMATMRMALYNGGRCAARNVTRTGGPLGNRQYPTTNLWLIQRPTQGTVTLAGSRATYVARAGAKGSDSFVYGSRTKGTTRDGESAIRYS